uniref:UBA domain-containing protein n=1 Tax=Peronospora matthiolae TaxID=2874970 RepID=A0AAV1SZE8_9STRA
MRVLRVRSVDDGRELLLERHGSPEDRLRVAELKQLILLQRHPLSTDGNASVLSSLEDCFVLLRGQILADPDVLDLNTLLPSDFFVFAPDTLSSTSFSVGSEADSGRKKSENDENSELFRVVQSQLVEMGFSEELAAQALRQSGNDLVAAASMLVEGGVHVGDEGHGLMLNETTAGCSGFGKQLLCSPLGSLVRDDKVQKLRNLAATKPFEALLLLKQQFSSDMLNEMNENPVATLQLLLHPAPTASLREGEMKDCTRDGAEDEGEQKVETAASSSSSGEAVERLVAMGFARDVVEVVYESCGSDEQLTANTLLLTLDS